MLVDEVGPGCPARQRLDPDPAGAGVEIDNAIWFNPKRPEHRKERFLDLVLHRSGECPGRPAQISSLRLASDDEHIGARFYRNPGVKPRDITRKPFQG